VDGDERTGAEAQNRWLNWRDYRQFTAERRSTEPARSRKRKEKRPNQVKLVKSQAANNESGEKCSRKDELRRYRWTDMRVRGRVFVCKKGRKGGRGKKRKDRGDELGGYM
jgi:hypothetical protein